ncbi:MAG: TetR/AcrR family transcriptional regulator [Solirubrobacteraceae bacterium]|nr:TetR/AcrR family transcriptional regulator [Solirubrobacteraceae bacterium]
MARPARISRDQIAVAALELLDAQGYEGLSMRSVASRLDVGTMTLYHHVADKEDLVGIAIDLVLAQMPELPTDRDIPGRDRVETIALIVFDHLMLHPGVLHVRQGAGPLHRLGTLGITEGIVQGLLDAGVERWTAGTGVTLILDYVLGCAAFSIVAEGDALLALQNALAPEHFPALLSANAGIIEHFGPPYTRRRMLEHNLGCILDGLGAEA